MIKAVIFDLDDTLYDYETLDKKARANVEAFTCKTLGITAEKYEEAYQFGRQETKRRLPDAGAGHNRLLYCQKTLEYLDVLPMPLSLRMYEEYWGTFLREMKLFPGVKDLFRYLKQKEIPIMICTDLTAHIQHRKIGALGITKDIKYLVSSEEAGKEKPAKEIFDLCLDKLRLPPESIWLVGDDLERDVKGALRAGMKAVWFHPEEKEMETGADIEQTEEGFYMQVQDFKQLQNVFVNEIERGR